MLTVGVHSKVVSERLGHANIGITLDMYSRVLPGLQEAATEKFGRMFEVVENENSDPNTSKMLASDEGVESRPCRSRTCEFLCVKQVPFVSCLSSLHCSCLPCRTVTLVISQSK
jgi:hypothetical protein